MFELFLNAVKIALSSDARDSVSTLIDFLNRSPDWQKEICTIEAKIPINERERITLIEDIIANKMTRLSYENISVASFRFIFGELTNNVIEHGIKNSKEKIIRIIIDVSPTYIAISVYNPRGALVNLEKWIKKGEKKLRASGMRGSGRGLLAVTKLADMTESIGSKGIKSIIYKDFLKITSKTKEDCLVIVPSGGRSNPSSGRRIIDYVKHLGERKIILCLDKNLFQNLIDKGFFDILLTSEVIDVPSISDAIEEYIEKGLNTTPEKVHVKIIKKELPPTAWFPMMLSLAENKNNIRIVYNEASLDGLFPPHLVFHTIDEAIKSFKKNNSTDGFEKLSYE